MSSQIPITYVDITLCGILKNLISMYFVDFTLNDVLKFGLVTSTLVHRSSSSLWSALEFLLPIVHL